MTSSRTLLAQLDSPALQSELVERFTRYVAIPSQSDSSVSTVPSTPGQLELARLLKGELEAMGFQSVSLSQHGVLIAHLPANTASHLPSVGFVAHLDTVDVNLSPIIQPQLLRYEGGDICLNDSLGIYLREAEHPEIAQYRGQEILFSDGTSVLGADDKSAIASLMAAMHHLTTDTPIPHGDLYLAFVPDEEIGLRGAKKMDLSLFPVDFAYTLDCCELGEVVYETFNAATATVTIHGVSAHPMSAKGVLLNPSLIAVDFASCFDRLQTPENTEGTEGYIWITAINSNQSTATVTLHVRDHSRVGYEAKKAYIQSVVEHFRVRYPRAVLECEIEDVYGNIRDAITDGNRQCVDYIFEAMHRLGVQPKPMAMRGGTDGSYISTQGIPTPNFFTGAHNFHSRFEFLPLPSFEKACRMVLTLLEIISEPE